MVDIGGCLKARSHCIILLNSYWSEVTCRGGWKSQKKTERKKEKWLCSKEAHMKNGTLTAFLPGLFICIVVKKHWTETRIYPKCCSWWKFTHLFWILVIFLSFQSEEGKKAPSIPLPKWECQLLAMFCIYISISTHLYVNIEMTFTIG